MQINVNVTPPPPPPPPPTPQDVVDAANNAINDLTGGGAPQGDGASQSGPVDVCLVPAPPAPYVPVPFPIFFTTNTAHHAAAAGDTPINGGAGSTGAAAPGSAKPISRPKHSGGISQAAPPPLALAVQAIAISLVKPSGFGTRVSVAIIVFVALVTSAADAHGASSEFAVQRTIDAILDRFRTGRHHPGKHKAILELRCGLHAAIKPGVHHAAWLRRIHPLDATQLAHAQLIRLLHR